MREMQSFWVFHKDRDEVIDLERPKCTNMIFQAAASSGDFTMKAILIGFEIQRPENITQMSAFIGNSHGNAAVVVKMPNPAKSLTLERGTP